MGFKARAPSGKLGDKFYINVTKRDIERGGVPLSGDFCPIARAAERNPAIAVASVTGEFIMVYVEGNDGSLAYHHDGGDFVRAFDRG